MNLFFRGSLLLRVLSTVVNFGYFIQGWLSKPSLMYPWLDCLFLLGQVYSRRNINSWIVSDHTNWRITLIGKYFLTRGNPNNSNSFPFRPQITASSMWSNFQYIWFGLSSLNENPNPLCFWEIPWHFFKVCSDKIFLKESFHHKRPIGYKVFEEPNVQNWDTIFQACWKDRLCDAHCSYNIEALGRIYGFVQFAPGIVEVRYQPLQIFGIQDMP